MTPEIADALNWYALTVKDPLVIAQALRRRGFTIFAPYKTIRIRRRRGRRESIAKDVPVIRGYVFVGAKSMSDQLWHELLRLREVQGIVCHDGRPANIPFKQLDRIRRRSWYSDFTDAQEARMRDEEPVAACQPALLTVGDSVEVLSGPWEGKAVEVMALGQRGDRNVVRFLTHAFGRDVEAEISVDNVVAA